jgi:hypothetical protein
MKELLRTMFEGWILRDQEGEDPSRTSEECMTKACGGDELKGHLLTLFGHWSNDIVSLAAHYGIGLARKQPDGSLLHEDGTVETLLAGGVLTIIDVPPAPSPEHYWHAGAWHKHESGEAL